MHAANTQKFTGENTQPLIIYHKVKRVLRFHYTKHSSGIMSNVLKTGPLKELENREVQSFKVGLGFKGYFLLVVSKWVNLICMNPFTLNNNPHKLVSCSQVENPIVII